MVERLFGELPLYCSKVGPRHRLEASREAPLRRAGCRRRKVSMGMPFLFVVVLAMLGMTGMLCVFPVFPVFPVFCVFPMLRFAMVGLVVRSSPCSLYRAAHRARSGAQHRRAPPPRRPGRRDGRCRALFCLLLPTRRLALIVVVQHRWCARATLASCSLMGPLIKSNVNVFSKCVSVLSGK